MRRVEHLMSKKDVETLIRRTEMEGLTFLTVLLPSLAKAVLESLRSENGMLPVVPCFEYKHNRPIFLRGLFSVLYDEHGMLRESFSKHVDILRFLIGDLRVFYKLRTPLTSEMSDSAWESYKETQRSLLRHRFIDSNIKERARKYISQALSKFDNVLGFRHSHIDPEEVIPRFSSGAVMEGISVIDRVTHNKILWPASLDGKFKENFWVNMNHWADDPDLIQPSEADCSRVLFVPKDSRGPRTICCEMAYRQAVQLGIMDIMYDRILANIHEIPLINQTTMQELAQCGSLYGVWSTLDQKSASDMVTMWHIKELFPRSWYEVLSSVRSSYAQYENTKGAIETIELQSAFPMGAAVCFPVLSLVTWALGKATGWVNNYPFAYAFGDDAIVPDHLYDQVVSTFEDAGFIINQDKSYHGLSRFRESCGGDYIDGIDVATNYIKTIQGISYTDSNDLLARKSLIAYLNGVFHQTGYYHPLVVACEELLTEPLHVSEHGPEIKGPYRAANDVFFRRRYNRHLQRHEVRLRSERPTKSWVGINNENSWALVHRYFVTGRSYHSAGDAYVYANPKKTSFGWNWEEVLF